MKIYFNNKNGQLTLVASLSNLQKAAKKINFLCETPSQSDESILYCSDNFSWDAKKKVMNVYGLEKSDEYFDAIDCHFDETTSYNLESDDKNASSKTLVATIRATYKCPEIESGFVFDKKEFYLLVRNILKKKNTLLTGPTGTGKTDIVMKVCEIMNIPCRVYDMGAMMDPLSDLLGQHKLKNGNSVFEYSRFVEDIQKPGVILLDEITRAPFGSNNILFPVLDQRRKLPVDIAGNEDAKEIKVHDDCVFIATANIGNDYTGTYELDSALLNRFIVMQVDYLQPEQESTLLIKKYGIKNDDATKIVAFANDIRHKYMSGNLSKPISTRETLTCAELLADGFSLVDSISFSMIEKFQKYGDNPEYADVKKTLLGF